ncbi:MAG: hypothetical protein BWK80_59765 [Desulfobacteraceae bacterium IS3]|nr:MAG: hypothetical protein BWK80_59765 [Desulfobacteraceae bacterium IS3]
MKKIKLPAVCFAVLVAVMMTGAILQAADAEKIDINTATEKELTQLDKIGPAIAARIVEYRQTNPFQKPEDIMNVSGIGAKIFESNKDRIVVGKPAQNEAEPAKEASKKKK